MLLRLVLTLFIAQSFNEDWNRDTQNLNLLIKTLRKTYKRKTSFFWTLSKSGLDPVPPPSVLDIREITFVWAGLG